MSAKERMIAYHIARLQDKRAEVRREAIQELALLEAVEALEPLEELLQNEADSSVLAAARQFIVQHQVNRLYDDDAAVRLAAIEMLDQLNAVEAYAELEKLFHSDASEDVKTAARKLGYKLFKLKQARPGSDGGG